MDIVCFHNPEEENGYLSNWYLSEFTVDGITFSSMEQFMMYKKAVCFEDKDTAEDVYKRQPLDRGSVGLCCGGFIYGSDNTE